MSLAETLAPVPGSAWRCPKCNRAFKRTRQPHSCKTVSLDDHFRSGELQSLFEHLLDEVNRNFGKCLVFSLPCCVHLAGKHDFLAVLPKKGRLEIRFVLERELTDPKVRRSAQISKALYKHSVDVRANEDIDETLLGWMQEAYTVAGN